MILGSGALARAPYIFVHPRSQYRLGRHRDQPRFVATQGEQDRAKLKKKLKNER